VTGCYVFIMKKVKNSPGPKKQTKKMHRLEIYVDPEVAKVLVKAAAKDGRTASNYIARVLAEYVETYHHTDHEHAPEGGRDGKGA
jgi:predicted HicB family RNase H-like nuclease